MASLFDRIEQELGKPYADLRFILHCFAEVLEEGGQPALARTLPWLHADAAAPRELSMAEMRVSSMCFHLLNQAEVNGAIQHRRGRVDRDGPAAINGSWAQAMDQLKGAGLTAEQVMAQLADTVVEPVLTAHPTEAKRATILEHHRELYLHMLQRENSMYTQVEQGFIRDEIKRSLDRIWRTGEVFTEKPDVRDERRNVMHYLTNVFPELLAILDHNLVAAWEQVGWEPHQLHEARAFPSLHLGNWVGGDRDGHPFVSAALTEETLQLFRLHGVIVVRRALVRLVERLSFAVELDDVIAPLRDRAAVLQAALGETGATAVRRNTGEAFRQFVNLCLHALPVHVVRGHATTLSAFPGAYTQAHELVHDLRLLQDALVQYGAMRAAYGDVHEALRIVETVGFHLARVDVRQNSAFHDRAIDQLMAASGAPTVYSSLSTHEQRALLDTELRTRRPFAGTGTPLGEEASSVVDCLRVLAAHREAFGTEGIGSLIVSMTRNVQDLLAVYLLCREAGLLVDDVCALPVVPLFETIDDLVAGPAIVDEFLSHPITQRSIKARVDAVSGEPELQVMIGYSDSNKDGGILASQWGLYTAQAALAEVGVRHGVRVVFFHGKGGSISRGAGPSHFFLRALPAGSIRGRLRVTEQGEAIAQKYANRLNAAFNLELMMAGTCVTTLLEAEQPPPAHPDGALFAALARDSQAAYETLVRDPGFVPFFREASPIDVIERSKIGSRPSRRSGQAGVQDLRAIPWVFSWSQSRFNLTAWYGVGTALAALEARNAASWERMNTLVRTDPFFRYVFTNIDTALAATNEGVAATYGALVEDAALRDRLLGAILGELRRTREHMDRLFGRPFAERRPNHWSSNQLREEALAPLHHTQVVQLKRWRALADDHPDHEPLLLSLLQSVNAIAGALRSTG